MRRPPSMGQRRLDDNKFNITFVSFASFSVNQFTVEHPGLTRSYKQTFLKTVRVVSQNEQSIYSITVISHNTVNLSSLKF